MMWCLVEVVRVSRWIWLGLFFFFERHQTPEAI